MIDLDVSEEMTIGLPYTPAKSQVVAILLIVKVVGDFRGDAGKHTRLIHNVLGKAGEVTKLTDVSILALGEDVASRLGLVEIVHPEGENLWTDVAGVFGEKLLDAGRDVNHG